MVTVTDMVTNERHFIVIGGYNGTALDSTEVLTNNGWTPGKIFDKHISLS